VAGEGRREGAFPRRDIHITYDFLVDNLSGERLELTRVDRRQMGAYLCIAKNEVPPAVSKRVNLKVNCEYVKTI
jgi:hypothetical protein